MQRGEIVWRPKPDARAVTEMGRFAAWVELRRGETFSDYEALRQWSITDLESFWRAVWDYFHVVAHRIPERVLDDETMPNVRWFPGTILNYAENALAVRGDQPAIIARSQTIGRSELTWDELRQQVAGVRNGLMRLGVTKGDRVAAYLPNIPEAVVGFLATVSLGAIWTSCPPEFGIRSVVDRFSQVTPKVLIAVSGYRYGDKWIDRRTELAEIRRALIGLESTVAIPYGIDHPVGDHDILWTDLLSTPAQLEFEPVAFDHPLFIAYSSGTTGIPKAIIHGHGGILLEHLKSLGLHGDLGRSSRCFRFTTTGWIMWNILLSSLLVGATAVLFDGNPAYPDLSLLWALAEEEEVTYFGVGAGFLLACAHEEMRPGKKFDLSRVQTIGSTGSPLPVEGYQWACSSVSRDAALVSGSGGTDVASGFIGGSPLVPIFAGEMSCRALACDVLSLDADGRSVIGVEGELVVRSPMPSMPVGFWGDHDGSRLRSAYFERYPGMWHHGDWLTITERGSCIISGRSDATLNRGGVRLGTADFYSIVEEMREVQDSLVVHLEDEKSISGTLILFVVLNNPLVLDKDLRSQISTRLKNQLSPRHIPDEILQVSAIPRTLTGKKLEIPVKRILRGERPELVTSKGTLANPESIEAFVTLSLSRLAASGGPEDPVCGSPALP
jgi:acetoacetyl-CoA synthetase